MTRIGVLSDTHAKALPERMINIFKQLDLIIHAGDICSRDQLDFLGEIKPTKAVFGNMDGADIKALLPDRLIFRVEDFNIGVFHGAGSSKDALEFVKEQFKNDDVDVVVFGHSHIPFNQKIDGVLYFNPGSPNDTIFAPYCSYGILEIDNHNIKSEIIKL